MTTLFEKRPKPLVLVILDGWGHSKEHAHNAIASARTPVWDRITREFPNGLINASELHVGLPQGQMGNSEVGHMNIGSGRVLMQDLPRIDAAIEDGSLARHPALHKFAKKVGGSKSCHLLGLLSPGGVHSHQRHMLSLAKILSDLGMRVRIHAFLDGRDTPPRSALDALRAAEEAIRHMPGVSIGSVCGRYWAMDRDKRWDRVRKAYEAITRAQGERFASARAAVEKSYTNGVTDEFIAPGPVGNFQGMRDGDGLIMANFRADRAREILTALLDPGFKAFTRENPVTFAAALGLTEYSAELNPLLATLFPPQPMNHIFGEIVSQAGLTQLRIAETEKYAHVTFFFNGGREEPFPGEQRILVPSPKVATYDLKPEMSAFEVTDRLVDAIESGRFDVIVVNYANTDMVGHTGDIEAARKAVETVDTCLGQVIDAALAHDGALLITADHGNAESMFDSDSNQPHTAHTLNLVPAILVAASLKGKKIKLPEGRLSDVAPTLLHMLQLPQPVEMTGKSLLAGHAA